jgi:hypothetical protein
MRPWALYLKDGNGAATSCRSSPPTCPMQTPPTQQARRRRPAPAGRLTGPTLQGDPRCILMAGAALSYPIPRGSDAPPHSWQPRPAVGFRRSAPAPPPAWGPKRHRHSVGVICQHQGKKKIPFAHAWINCLVSDSPRKRYPKVAKLEPPAGIGDFVQN